MGILFSKAPSSPCIRTNPEVLPFTNNNNLSVANVEDINLQEKSPDKHSESSDERLYDSDESLPDHVPELVEAIIQQENIQLVVGESGDLVEPIEQVEIIVEEQVVEQPVIKEIHEEIEVDKVDEVAPAEPVIHENAEEDTREHKED